MIRRLGPEDAAAYTALRREALGDAPLAFSSSPEEDAIRDLEIVRARLAASADAFVFAALDATDALVGMIGVRREPQRKGRHKAIIWGMYVTSAARGSGVADELLTAAVDAARSMAGVTWVQLSVSSTAHAARRLYERAGFLAWGTEPDALRDAGQSADETHMALRISEP